MNELFSLIGKNAVVTGGSRGLGREIAIALAEAGANIAIISRTVCPDVIEIIRKLGVRAISISADLGEFEQYPQILKIVEQQLGEVDILVNNAGIQKRYPAVEFPQEDWNSVMDVNANSIFLLCQLFSKSMISRGEGKIINIASLLSYQGGLNIAAYAASKHAVTGLTKALANEWASKGLNVNAIAPGYMATDMNEALLADHKRSMQILERIPAARWGNGQDIKGAVIFLASPAANYVNGFTIAVDGGWLGR
ncbi:SDR family NAD(P)-dependent oxidoreductase [Kurthia sibirica]|uniref:2-deoxy-D-gluconate 3-dehydrogenase n=1 Tax=Kurthia sibirica TaxID=202750 RepID=A0A2U3AIB0_9BACL|nr:SDR family NAD(P)-dependent oxidoreductase [Kurthia sibirica]PWI24191.1 2-deoxy-D-gluconate 3-dehydrogenase [Kurthia sibirica]GEK34811.1 2-deoxy-D-gluconate 3-dehydrogenase [Kurthia sibirica]